MTRNARNGDGKKTPQTRRSSFKSFPLCQKSHEVHELRVGETILQSFRHDAQFQVAVARHGSALRFPMSRDAQGFMPIANVEISLAGTNGLARAR